MEFSQSWCFTLHTGTEQKLSLCKGGKSLQWRRAAWGSWDRNEWVNPNLDMRVGQKTDPKLQCQCCQSGSLQAHRSEHRVAVLVAVPSFPGLTVLAPVQELPAWLCKPYTTYPNRGILLCMYVDKNSQSEIVSYKLQIWFSPKFLPDNCFARQLLHFHFVAFSGLSLEME